MSVARMSSVVSSDSCCRLFGIAPLSSLNARFSSWRLVRSASSVGILPLSSLPPRFRLVTRPLPSVSTPNHSESGAALSQLVLFLQSGPPVA